MFLLTVCNFLIGSAWLYRTMYLLGVQYANFGIKPISSKYELESAIPILILSNIFVYWSNKKKSSPCSAISLPWSVITSVVSNTRVSLTVGLGAAESCEQ